VRSVFGEEVLEENVGGNADEAGKEDKKCPLFVGELFFYHSSEIEDDEENGVNDDENVRSDEGEGGNSWVVLGEFHRF
jgi:hypothetical protein